MRAVQQAQDKRRNGRTSGRGQNQSTVRQCSRETDSTIREFRLVKSMSCEPHVLQLPSGRLGEGNGNPRQCSCLENPMDGGAWWAAVYGVAQSQTRLKRLSSSGSSSGRLKRNLNAREALDILTWCEYVEWTEELPRRRSWIRVWKANRKHVLVTKPSVTGDGSKISDEKDYRLTDTSKVSRLGG